MNIEDEKALIIANFKKIEKVSRDLTPTKDLNVRKLKLGENVFTSHGESIIFEMISYDDSNPSKLECKFSFPQISKRVWARKGARISKDDYWQVLEDIEDLYLDETSTMSEHEQIIEAFKILSFTDPYGYRGCVNSASFEVGVAYKFSHHGEELELNIIAMTDDSNDGTPTFIVFSIPQISEKLWRINGYYSSWDGENWDDVSKIEEVEAKERIVVYYEPVK